jgi:hypothetical protein
MYLSDLTRIIESETENLISKLAGKIEEVARLTAATAVRIIGAVLHSVEEDGLEPHGWFGRWGLDIERWCRY